MTFTEIKRIREKYFDVDETDVVRPSKRSQALKLIQEGKSDVDIAMELDLSAKEILGFRKEYLILKDEDDLLRNISAVEVICAFFLTLYREMIIEEFRPEEAVIGLKPKSNV